MLFLIFFYVKILISLLGDYALIKFSAPEERAVKAVLIHKNQKIALMMLRAFFILLVGVLVYCAITIPKNNIKNAFQLFSDNIFTGLVVFCTFTFFLVVYFINVPISKKRIKENSGYKVVFEKDKIKVLFPEEPEIIVNLDDVDDVEEYDIFYLIHCYKFTDEIVCSKTAFEEGDAQEFLSYFNNRGFVLTDNRNVKIYVSLINKINSKTRAGYSSLIYSLLGAGLAFPLFWFAVNVLILFVPNLLSLIMFTLWDFSLIVKLALGILFLPLALVATIIAGITALGIILVPPSLVYLSAYKAGAQLKIKDKVLGILASVICGLVAIFILLVLLLVIGIL